MIFLNLCTKKCHHLFINYLFTLLLILIVIYPYANGTITEDERIKLRDESKEMFYHAYNSYMSQAYPADELMPLSCKGRYRDSEPNRGDVDDALGNFSLTLVDCLDSLVILGNYTEFEKSVARVIRDVQFDSDIVVSVFETNIRMLGGLLSGHILSEYLQTKFNLMKWYNGQLLSLAKELGYRLLPAFNTSTGIPHPRINLKYGLKSSKIGSGRETCTSCAGTMILEFAALSRLTGEPIFELKARAAMDYLWHQRHRSSDLVGTVLNIHSGDWIRRESGVGAGIDSYYEYCLKAYILLGDESYLDRFNRHYAGIMKYVSQGPLLVDVHMHRPHNQAKNFMDALLAFWPGIQVLKGDMKPAIETHEMLYQIMQRHNFLPEAFTTDFQIHWGHHPLRPEFLESTYYLYKATGDSYYLTVGKHVLESLQKYARVKCGFAAVKDVRTGIHEDRMDSFVLAETLKYLYLLFAVKDDIDLDLDEFLFTTEAHLLPLSLSRPSINNASSSGDRQSYLSFVTDDEKFSHSCPNTRYFLGKHHHGADYANTIRTNLKDFVKNSSKSLTSSPSPYPHPRPPFARLPKLRASEFLASNKEHLETIKRMGISVIVLADGRVQLVHNSAAAASSEDADEGAQFMQDMIALSKQQLAQTEQRLRTVSFTFSKGTDNKMVKMVLSAGPAQFGFDLTQIDETIDGPVIITKPINGCRWPLDNRFSLNGKIAIVERGDCMFIEKARNIQRANGIGVIVLDNVPNTSSKSSPMFAMSGDGHDDVDIPVVFLYWEDGQLLQSALREHSHLIVSLGVHSVSESQSDKPKIEPLTDDDSSPHFDGDSIEKESRDELSLGTRRGVAHIRDVTDDVLGSHESSRDESHDNYPHQELIDIDKVLNILNMDISKKYSDYVRKNLHNLNVDNKIIDEIWNSVFESTVKTMQHVFDSHKYKNIVPVVNNVFKSSKTLSDVRNTINHWIDYLKHESAARGSCHNPLRHGHTFKQMVSKNQRICPVGDL